ncbi:hypothetical protein [Actinomycetospora atypica]|uniref:Uncharacterized protein n=1 Tax=Actinomycetospora atypica TaxID=1290095 RepID=A0ABV9YEA1_9PSEU
MTDHHEDDDQQDRDKHDPAHDYEGEEPVDLSPAVEEEIQRVVRGAQEALEPLAHQQAKRIQDMLGEILRPPQIPPMRFAMPIQIVPPLKFDLPIGPITALTFKPQISLLPPITTQLDEVLANLRTSFAPPTFDFSWLADSFRKWRESLLPPNLIDFELSELFRLTDIAEEQRIGVVWAPSAEVLRELLDADDEQARTAVVDRHRDRVVDECAEVLADCEADWLVDLPALLKRAVAAYRSGHPESGQALATSVLDTAIHKHFAEKMNFVKALAKEKGPDAQL